MDIVFGIIGLAVGFGAGFFLAQNQGKQAVEKAKAAHGKAIEKLKKQHDRRLEDSTSDFQQRLQVIERERDNRIESLGQDYQGQLDTLNQQLEGTAAIEERAREAEKRTQELQVHNDNLTAQNQQLAKTKADLEVRLQELEGELQQKLSQQTQAAPVPEGLGDEFDALFSEISGLANDEAALPDMEELPAPPPAPESDLDAGMNLQELDSFFGSSPAVASAEVAASTPEAMPAASAGGSSSADVDISEQLDELDALLSSDLTDELPALEDSDSSAGTAADDLDSLFEMFPDESGEKQS